MANALYDSYKESLLDGSGPDLTGVDVKAALVDLAVYTFSAAHDFYDDVSSAVLGTPVSLASKTVTDGVFDAADTTISSVAQSNGDEVTAVVLYIDDASAEATSPLIGYWDEGITVTPNGEDIVIRYNASGIFAL